MRPRRHRWLVLATILALAYGGALFLQLRRTAARTHDDGRIVLRFAHWQLESGMREAFDFMAQRYMELHPDVRVEPIAVPGMVYTQWLNTQLIGGTAPDLVMFDSRFSTEVHQMTRFFEPLSRWLGQENPYNAGTPLAGMPWRLTFIDGLRNRTTYNEQLRDYFAVSLCSHAMLMFYNRDLLREITGHDAPPETFRDWLALGRKVRAHRPGLAHVSGARHNAEWLMAMHVNQSVTRWLLQADHSRRFAATATDVFGDLIDREWEVDSPPIRTALRLMHAIGGEMTPGFLQLDKSTALSAFVRGEALEYYSGTWDYPSLQALAGFEVGGFMVPVPADTDPDFGGHALLPAASGVLSTAMPFFLNRQSRHQAVAIDFLRYLTSMEGNALFSREARIMPAIEGVKIAPELRQFRANYDGYVVTAVNNGLSLMYGTGPDYTRLWLSHLHELFSPGGGVETYARTLAAGIHQAAVTDLQGQLKNRLINLRQRDAVLAAMLHLEAGDRQEAEHQLTAQHLVEVQTYLLAQKLATASRP